MVSARVLVGGQQPEMAVGLPLMAGMLLLGRGVGVWWRSKTEPALRFPALLWLGSAIAALACVAAVWWTVTHP